MNCYTDIETVKAKLGITGTSYDRDVLAICNAVSRDLETAAGRVFYVTEGQARYFDGTGTGILLIDDLLSATDVATDTDGDESYADTWIEGTDYVLEPRIGYPKTMLRLHLDTNDMALGGAGTTAYFKITGNWGAGNMRSASPWRASGITGTVADTTGTSLTLSAAGTARAGHTIRIENEQMFVESVDDATATVIRGVNNTTAAAHTAADITLAEYPDAVIMACAWMASATWREFAHAGYESERIGDYSYKISTSEQTQKIVHRITNSVRREVMG